MDEADQMVNDKESLSIVTEIHAMLIKTTISNSARLQVCFFSATLHTKNVRSLAETMTNHATWVDLKGRDVVPETVDHLIVPLVLTSNNVPWGRQYKYDDLTDSVHSQDSLVFNRSLLNETKNNKKQTSSSSSKQEELKNMKSHMIKRMKLEMIKRIIDTFNMSTCMIFCRTNVDCNNLETYFKQLSGGGGKYNGKRESGKENVYSCVVVAGKREQRERRENLDAFRDGDIRFLICTDVAARGIDIKELPFVIQMTLPDEPEQYYHRIGRVGRAGRMGLAISLVAINDYEKVWYHANCKRSKGGKGGKGGKGRKGTPCHQTTLVKNGGCCIYYNEPVYLLNIEKKLDHNILRIDSNDLILPKNMNVDNYGEKKDETKKKETSTRIQGIQPAVTELTEMEVNVQTMWLMSQKRYGNSGGGSSSSNSSKSA